MNDLLYKLIYVYALLHRSIFVHCRYDIQEMLNGTEYYTQPTLIERLNESLGIMMHDNGTINSYNNKMYTYVIMDWRVDNWKPIMMISEEKEGLTVKRLTTNARAFFTVENIDFIPCDADNDCTSNYQRNLEINRQYFKIINIIKFIRIRQMVYWRYPSIIRIS